MALSLMALILGGAILAGGAPPRSGDGESAVVGGTVFRDPGFALPGAEVALTVTVPPDGFKPPKPQKARSDARGEFAFRVPPAKAQYLVTVKAAGYIQQEKAANVSGGPERVDVYFQLKSESK